MVGRRNLLLTLRFVGTNYAGFQVQQNATGICTVIQDAIERVLGERVPVKGCSRTDAGVHASNYCLSFVTSSAVSCEGLPLALNTYLPGDIAVTSCREVPLDFHARYSATGKEYTYKLLNSRVRDPFLEGLCHRLPHPIDADALHAQAQDFIGRHDFAAFKAKGGKPGGSVRTITYFSVKRQGELVLFTVRGDGFLYKMVRIMVGTLLGVASGRLPPGCIPGIIASKDRARAGKTAPACGLYLSDVYYS